MAGVPNQRLVTAEEYLATNYRPDVEYVEGVLVERGVPTIAHSLLHFLLMTYLDRFRKALQFVPLPDARTQIVERAKYRIPDVLLCPLPLPQRKVMTVSPWAVIEILSPEDRIGEQMERFRDYKQIGVRHVILLDPENLVAFRFEDGSLLQTMLSTLELPTGTLPFDSQALFRQLTEELNQGRE